MISPADFGIEVPPERRAGSRGPARRGRIGSAASRAAKPRGVLHLEIRANGFEGHQLSPRRAERPSSGGRHEHLRRGAPRFRRRDPAAPGARRSDRRVASGNVVRVGRPRCRATTTAGLEASRVVSRSPRPARDQAVRTGVLSDDVHQRAHGELRKMTEVGEEPIVLLGVDELRHRARAPSTNSLRRRRRRRLMPPAPASAATDDRRRDPGARPRLPRRRLRPADGRR